MEQMPWFLLQCFLLWPSLLVSVEASLIQHLSRCVMNMKELKQ